MRVASPPLLPLLRSRLQGTVLAACYLHPEREFSVTELAAISQATPKATGHEVGRLVSTGFLTDRRRGNLRLVRRPTDNPVTAPMTGLMAATFGPLPVLAGLLDGTPGLAEAFIYGSWAARYTGNAGPLPGDVDVLAIGDTAANLLDEAADAAERTLLRPVDIHRVSTAQWLNPKDHFIATVKAGPLVKLPLGAAKGSP
jgi:hypothetical protein